MTLSRRLLLALAVALFSIRTAEAEPSQKGAGPKGLGKDAPSLTLPSEAGSEVSFASLRGRVVIVDFWATWCAPCEKAFPQLDALRRELSSKGVEVVAINVDEDRKKALRFLSTHAHEMLVLFDPSGHSAEAFQVEGMPTTFVLDQQGVIRHISSGFKDGSVQDLRRIALALVATPPGSDGAPKQDTGSKAAR